MSMKLVKKGPEYAIYQRGDERYAVKDAAGKAVNGDEKVQILLAEGLITVTAPAAPAEPEPEVAEEAAADDAGDDAVGTDAAEGEDA